jgi:LmbE family N-acetylglucosaminyl deacetylase
MPSAIAIAAHPDDIEFVMAGTLLLLAEAGWEIHYFNLSTGNVGSMTMSPVKTAQVRRREAQAAARRLGAKWHAPIRNDIEIFYDDRTLREVASVIRNVAPTVVLTHATEDYMEDHMNTARVAVTAAFTRGMPNYKTRPARPPVEGPVAVYHAAPHGLCDGLRRPFEPHLFIDTTTVHAVKREALACHASQKEWLDATQGMDSYLVALDHSAAQVARLTRKRNIRQAEAWRRHSHLGFAPSEEFDPLREALAGSYREAGQR